MNRRDLLKGATAGVTALFLPKALAIPGDEEFELTLPGSNIVEVKHEVTIMSAQPVVLDLEGIDPPRRIALIPGDTLRVFFVPGLR